MSEENDNLMKYINELKEEIALLHAENSMFRMDVKELKEQLDKFVTTANEYLMKNQ